MLNKDLVAVRLAELGVSLKRKIDQRVIEIYHRRLAKYIDDDQFNRAAEAVGDEDDKFPSVARLLQAARGLWSRERGVAHVVDANRQDMGTLSEYLSDLDSGRGMPSDEIFRGRPGVAPMIERLVYEDAVATTPQEPGEELTHRLKRIASVAEAEIARLEARAEKPRV